MTFRQIQTLQGLRLPETGQLRRDHVRPPDNRPQRYLDGYDDRTVFYDCVARPDGKGVTLTCPPLLNLWPHLRGGLSAQGQPLARRMRKWSHGQADLIHVRGATKDLTLNIDGHTTPVTIRSRLAARFAGLNALVSMNKNNPLDWIQGWLRHYRQNHGLQAVLIFDNGTEDYSMEALMDCIASVDGLDTIVILQAPFPYGPAMKPVGNMANPRFLQTSMLNLARVDALSQARAVLNVDIDEIIHVADGRSIFDLAVDRRNTMVKVHGSWVYPAPSTDLPAGHTAHTHRAQPNARCNQKWCAVPSGLLSRFGWGVHHVGGRLVRLVKATPGVELYHCLGTSTAWKSKRFDRMPTDLAPDAALRTFWQTRFPTP